MASTNAEATISKMRTCFSAYGVPENIVTDGGPPFQSSTLENFFKSNGIKHIFAPSYHPSSNGQAENMVGTFKTSLLKQVLQDNIKGLTRNILHKLDCFLFAYRNTPHSMTGKIPAELFLGFHPRTRLALLKPHLQSSMEDKLAKVKINCDKRRGPNRTFGRGQEVLVRSVRGEEIKWMPGTVIKVVSPTTFVVDVMGKKRFVHADHIRETELEFPRLTQNTTMHEEQSLHSSNNIDLNTSKEVGLQDSSPPKTVSPPRPTSPASPQSTTSPSVVHKVPSPKSPSAESLRRSKRMRKPPEKLDL